MMYYMTFSIHANHFQNLSSSIVSISLTVLYSVTYKEIAQIKASFLKLLNCS